MTKTLQGLLSSDSLKLFGIFFNSSSLRIVGAGAGFTSVLMVTTLAGTAQAGILYATLAWTTGLSILTRWGVTQRAMIELPRSQSEYRRIFIPALINSYTIQAFKRAGLILLGFAILWMLGGALGYNPALSIWLFITFLPSYLFMQLFAVFARASGHFSISIICEFLLPPLAILLTLGLIVMGVLPNELFWLGTAYVLSFIIAGAICFQVSLSKIWYFRSTRYHSIRGNKRGQNLALTEMSAFFSNWAVMLSLPFWLTAQDIGLFNLAFRIASSIGMVTATLSSIFIQKLSTALSNRDLILSHQIIVQTRFIMLGLGVCFAVFSIVFGPIILAWLGPEFITLTSVLYILALGYAIGEALGPNGNILIALNQEAVVRNINIAIAIMGFLFVIPALGLGGLTGGAILTSTSYVLLKSVLLIYERKYMRANPISFASSKTGAS